MRQPFWPIIAIVMAVVFKAPKSITATRAAKQANSIKQTLHLIE